MSDTTRIDIESLTARPHAQVLIIGGGINGIGTFRDLALQGVDVMLIERDDWASGASAASSHMIHGGIRYLENGEFRLVKESVTERNGLLRIAPHYVKPLPTTIPIFSTFSGIASAPLRFLRHGAGKPKERGAALIKIGLAIYDAFSSGRDGLFASRGGVVPPHRFHGHVESLRELPKLNPAVKYTATYYDGSLVNPERLALDVLLDGIAAGAGATAPALGGGRIDTARAANYLAAVDAHDDRVTVRDQLTGEEFELTADVVVNATGPWTDLTNGLLGTETRLMGGTKGSHVVVDNPELYEACAGRELFFEHRDGRIVLVYPLHGKVIIGTTDLEQDMAQPIEVTDAEIDYFFELVRDVFPTIHVGREQIVFRFVGVRPLPRHDDTQPGFVSRDYRIVESPLPGLPKTPVLSLVGGKWTTFRALGEHLANEALAKLGRERLVSTAGMAIGGGRDFPTTDAGAEVWAAAYADTVGVERAARLLDRYGTKAAEVIQALGEGDRPLASAPEYSRDEIAHVARTEQVVHLIDVLTRRTNIAFRGALTTQSARELAEVVGDALGWDDARRASELADAADRLAEKHGVVLELSEEANHA
ncbi:glycerol-3-phosphate dehydrogenase/oxidase [Gryllotalpicola protaetiae]|uniref:Glycerol-3-phosphate dehydrogenase/oxidase n=1 Tax=Gryllotalpicola protaetiae TaxID=2419771 RepID=A0A387BQ06_9MICO|nr:glycerol-3-phosphate dehydrogenase/oxidase [Gryllotalpicola protaetiae]AYG03046.1 glycerol-3-phosphate dehydrogenase/oxidase [Gryllotalpicola protaetiae]